MTDKQYREIATNGCSVLHRIRNPVYIPYDRKDAWLQTMGLLETRDVIR